MAKKDRDIKDIRKQLIGLGPEELAEALMHLASHNDGATDLIERMVAAPQENIRRFKSKLKSLKRSQSFIDWQEAHNFSMELAGLLDDLRVGIKDPKVGVELAIMFFECDNSIFERCDDSNGRIGDMFYIDARDVFIYHASSCSDKNWLCDQLLKLNEKDDYGVREVLFNSASAFLPAEPLRNLLDRLLELSEKDVSDTRKSGRWLFGAQTIARQLGDTQLFEIVKLAACPEPSASTCMDIARVYLETGDALTALSWMNRISADNHFQVDERNQILRAIYEKLGDREKLAEVAWDIFQRSRNRETLEALLKEIGEEHRDKVIEDQSCRIMKSDRFSSGDTKFLIEMDRMNDAAKYILQRVGQLNGEFYSSLLSIATSMEKAGHWLAATVIYRALLDFILQRGISKYYPYGIRYLRKLDSLSPKVPDWQNILPHDEYKNIITEAHGRKKSFWSKY